MRHTCLDFKKFQRIVHLDFLRVVDLFKTASIASSKTSFKPCWFRAETNKNKMQKSLLISMLNKSTLYKYFKLTFDLLIWNFLKLINILLNFIKQIIFLYIFECFNIFGKFDSIFISSYFFLLLLEFLYFWWIISKVNFCAYL